MEPKDPKKSRKPASQAEQKIYEDVRRQLAALDQKVEARLQPPRETESLIRDFTGLLQAKIPQVEAELERTRKALDEAKEALRHQEGELGRLRVLAERVPELTAQVDQLRQELAQARAEADRRVAEEVRLAVEAINREHEAAAEQWSREKTGLEQRIKDLQTRTEAGVGGHIAPSDLASRFASVLDELSEGRPAAAGRTGVAALTSLEVEARGLLEAPQPGEEQPRFVTAPGTVDPAALSTMKMTFRLLPRTETPRTSEE